MMKNPVSVMSGPSLPLVSRSDAFVQPTVPRKSRRIAVAFGCTSIGRGKFNPTRATRFDESMARMRRFDVAQSKRSRNSAPPRPLSTRIDSSTSSAPSTIQEGVSCPNLRKGKPRVVAAISVSYDVGITATEISMLFTRSASAHRER